MRLTTVLWATARKSLLLKRSPTDEVKRVSGLSERNWQKFWEILCKEWTPVEQKEYTLLGEKGKQAILDRVNATLAKNRIRKIDYEVGEWAIYRRHVSCAKLLSFWEAKREWAAKFTKQHPVDSDSGWEMVMAFVRTAVDDHVAARGYRQLSGLPKKELQVILKQVQTSCEQMKLPEADEWLLLYLIKRRLGTVIREKKRMEGSDGEGVAETGESGGGSPGNQ